MKLGLLILLFSLTTWACPPKESKCEKCLHVYRVCLTETVNKEYDRQELSKVEIQCEIKVQSCGQNKSL